MIWYYPSVYCAYHASVVLSLRIFDNATDLNLGLIRGQNIREGGHTTRMPTSITLTQEMQSSIRSWNAFMGSIRQRQSRILKEERHYKLFCNHHNFYAQVFSIIMKYGNGLYIFYRCNSSYNCVITNKCLCWTKHRQVSSQATKYHGRHGTVYADL